MLSRELAISLGVQVAPGVHVTSSIDVRAFAARHGIGYPIMIKALDGGGGRGIRVVNNASGVEEAFKRFI
jgi:biotin carboxylase